MASDPAINATLYDRAQAAAETARHAADQAKAYADQVGHSAGGGATAASGAIDPSVFGLVILVLSCFIGYYAVRSVTLAQHTPLMSVTNAMSSVIIVGALLAVGVDASEFSNDGPIWARIFGFVAVILASANIVGGFLVTERMLSMDEKG